LHMAQLMPLPVTVSCSSKIHIGFTFLVPAHPGSPGQRAVKLVCVCVCVTDFISSTSITWATTAATRTCGRRVELTPPPPPASTAAATTSRQARRRSDERPRRSHSTIASPRTSNTLTGRLTSSTDVANTYVTCHRVRPWSRYDRHFVGTTRYYALR